MTMDDELLALAARCEAASEGSEELDQTIADVALVRDKPARLVGSPVDLEMWRYPDGSIGTALRFTRSLDAALSLVPEGWQVCLDSMIFGSATPAPRTVWTAWLRTADAVYRDFPGQGGSERVLISGKEACSVQRATPALALCGAALRARAAQLTAQPRL